MEYAINVGWQKDLPLLYSPVNIQQYGYLLVLKNLRILRRLFSSLISTNFINLKENLLNCIQILDKRLKEKQEEIKSNQSISFPLLSHSLVASQQQQSEISQISDYLSHLDDGNKNNSSFPPPYPLQQQSNPHLPFSNPSFDPQQPNVTSPFDPRFQSNNPQQFDPQQPSSPFNPQHSTNPQQFNPQQPSSPFSPQHQGDSQNFTPLYKFDQN